MSKFRLLNNNPALNAYAREAGLYRVLFDIKQLKNLGMTEKREYLWRFIALMGIFIPLCPLISSF